MQRQKSFVHRGGSGTLYLVGTPIGNMGDITIRAIETLKEVDVIAAEDTRHTRKLTAHFKIKTPLVSYREHNHRKQGPVLLERLIRGESVALVSDAGLPTISDPGVELVKDALERNIAVVPIPGANAALSALIGSGLATERFLFLGFLPRDRQACLETLREWRSIDATLLLYEAPHRLLSTLRLIRSEWGNRRGSVVRELTKRHEEWLRGTIDEFIERFEREAPRGECSIVIEGESRTEEKHLPWWHTFTLEEHVDHFVQEGASARDAIRQVALERGISKREVYNRYHNPS